MENFMRYKLTDGNVKIRMKREVVPQKFECQKVDDIVFEKPPMKMYIIFEENEQLPSTSVSTNKTSKSPR